MILSEDLYDKNLLSETFALGTIERLTNCYVLSPNVKRLTSEPPHSNIIQLQLHSVFSSIPSAAPFLPCMALASCTLWTSFDGVGDGLISIKLVSSLSNSSPASDE